MNEESSSVAAPRLHHVNLKTCRMDEMIEWYGKVAGMRVQFKSARGAWLTNDAANHRLALLSTPALSDDADKLLHTGMHHLAFEFGDLDQLLDAFVRLREEGVVPHAGVDHGMTLSFYYIDPDGNSVELQVDRFGDWAASSEFMRSSPDFARNPIGEPVDGDRLIDARMDGASIEELHRRAYAGEFAPKMPLDLRLPTS
jgi:catechol 2,3-dioxygenase